MCKTRHIQRTISKQKVSEYVNSVFLRGGTNGLKQFREQILRLNERGGLVLVTSIDKDLAITAYALDSYRR